MQETPPTRRDFAIFYLVAGARPNFIKLAPLVHELKQRNLPFRVVHTGQHYDDALSDSFFRLLEIPAADVNLEVGSASHGVQTARILERFENLLLTSERITAVVVFGDVNSTVACALAASKLNIPLVHVEAGLRSFDRTMPEEVNRVVTDSLSDLLLVSEISGVKNLAREGIDPERIHLVGNIMIDSLRKTLPAALERQTHRRFATDDYGLVTLHRPANVDEPAVLLKLVRTFERLSAVLPLVFSVHPRTRGKLEQAGFSPTPGSRLQLVEPFDYLDSLCMQKHARLVLTDSGGMQEETSWLQVPCITLRPNTERPATVEEGTSFLVGNDSEAIEQTFHRVLEGGWKKSSPILLWDGFTAGRVAALMQTRYQVSQQQT